MKVVCISDTHGQHRKLDVPDGDILIHAGDIDPIWGSLYELIDFLDWLKQLPHKHKVFIAGNHDLEFQSKPFVCQELIKSKNTGIYLENQSIEIDGIKIYGSPHTVPFAGAFNSSDNIRKSLWKKIPDDSDIIITHGPPYCILDETNYGDNVGDGFLYSRIREIKPKLHVFGHIHESYGVYHSDFGTSFVNAAISNGSRLNEPIVIEI